MTILDALLLALALSIDSLVVATACALKNNISRTRGLLLAATFALFQGGFPLIGALIGNSFQHLIESVDHWIAFALLAIVGLKMIVDALRGDDGDRKLDISRYWVICALAVSTSIDAFAVGIGLGLENTTATVLKTVAVIAVVTFLAAMLGLTLGHRNAHIPERWAGILAGLVLIALGTHTLLEHLQLL